MVYDSFSRSNSATLGTTETTNSATAFNWAIVTGSTATFAISSQKAVATAHNGGGPAQVEVNSLKSDCTVSGKLTTLSANGALTGLIFRGDGTVANMWAFVYDNDGILSNPTNKYAIMSSIAGTFGNYTAFTATSAANDELKVVLSGSSITASIVRDGTAIETKSISSTSLQSNTYHGLISSDISGSTGVMDDLVVGDCAN